MLDECKSLGKFKSLIQTLENLPPTSRIDRLYWAFTRKSLGKFKSLVQTLENRPPTLRIDRLYWAYVITNRRKPLQGHIFAFLLYLTLPSCFLILQVGFRRFPPALASSSGHLKADLSAFSLPPHIGGTEP